jgi:O-antigen ligase
MLTLPRQQSNIFLAGATLLVISVIAAILADAWILLAIPFVGMAAVFVALRPASILYILFAIIPFSTEVTLPGGFGLDLPAEPLMIISCGLLFLMAITHMTKWDSRYFVNSLTLTILGMLVWTVITTIFSTEPVISVKYILAKLWYIIPFYLGTIVIFHQDQDRIRALIKVIVGSTIIALCYVVARHSLSGFDFTTINRAGRPFFRNHVNYGALLVLTLPFLGYLYKTSRNTFKGLCYGIALCLILFAIYTTYTRAAYVCVFGIIAGIVMIKYRLTTIAFIIAGLVSIIGLGKMINQNAYLEYAPNYQNTISHHNIDNLMEATIKGEDVSTMERVYRWVAGIRMISDKPIVGFGPGAFFESYEPYTVRSFETYVSNNPEKSGIHNYYLMVACEQGIIGLLFFLLLTALPLLLAERAFAIAKDQHIKYLAMASALSLITIDLLLLINDLLEADKVGPYYFLSIALITICYVHTQVTNKAT